MATWALDFLCSAVRRIVNPYLHRVCPPAVSTAADIARSDPAPTSARLAAPDGARTGLYPCRCHSWSATFHRASRAGCLSSTGMKRHLPCFRTPLVRSLGGLRSRCFSVQGPSTKCDPASTKCDLCSELQKLQGRFRAYLTE